MRKSSRFDVCIVGAGAAGCFLAKQLAEQGKNVALLEAGSHKACAATDLGMSFDYAAYDYPGATVGRQCGIGGSTSKWGGLLVPHNSSDLRSEACSSHQNAWQKVIHVVEQQSSAVLKQLGLGEVASFTMGPWPAGIIEILAQSGLAPVSGLFLPFRRKNFRCLIENHASRGTITILSGHQVTDFQVENDATFANIMEAIAVAPGGQIQRIAADEFVVAAGTLESTRIMLELQEKHSSKIVFSNQLGKCLGDHLSLGIADVAESDRAKTVDYFAPSFDHGCMRNTRFLETRESNNPRHFLHFIFENKDPGFALAKEFLLALQGRRLPSVTPGDVGRGMVGAARLAFTRFIRSRLYVPANSRIVLQLDMEQLPHAANCIRLSGAYTPYGRRKAVVDWRITSDDLQQMRLLAQRYVRQWNETKTLPRLLEREIIWENTKPHDAFHPVGTLRLGDDPDAVVDFNYRAGNCRNLRIISTGLLPTAGTANPTFTMLCLASDLSSQMCSTGPTSEVAI